MIGTATAEPAATRLRPYVPRLALDWLEHDAGCTYKTIDGALAFVDVSGFTPLSERLAMRGKAGAEEIGQIITDAFAAQLDVARECGGELLKWGGDAVLLLFRGPHAARSACRAAWLMSKTMARVGRLQTSAGRVQLGVSAAVNAGPLDLYLVGGDYRELIVAGETVTATTRLEHAADAGEVIVGKSAAALVEARALGAEKGGGVLLGAAVRAPFVSPQAPLDDIDRDPSTAAVGADALLSPDLRRHLDASGETAEHRYASIAFVEFTGVDDLRSSKGPGAVAQVLDTLIRRTQRAAQRHGATFHYTDVVPGGGKILLTGGLPAVRGDDEERVLRAALDTVRNYRGPLELRAGLNSGRFFAHDVGTADRRVYSFSGDAVNLAARVMTHSGRGQVLATDTFLARVRPEVVAQPVAPFAVKGKTDRVNASIVTRVGSRSAEITYSVGAFVGRADELGVLLHAAASAGNGSGQVVDIVAEPGMGKSRLVSEAAARWSLDTRRSVAETFGDAAPYLPFRHLVRALLDVEPDASPATVASALQDTIAARAPRLLEWTPLLGALLDVPTPTTSSVDRLDRRFRRERLEESTIALLDALVTAPTALVFEDVHAADDPSKALLGRLAQAARNRPWLVVTTRRPYGDLALPRDEPWVHEIRLGALTAAESASLLSAARHEDVTLLPHQRRLIMERAGGSPLFLEELLDSFRSTRSTEALPDSLDSLLAMQVDRLAPNDRIVLRAAAVIGVWFDVDTLTDVLDSPRGIDPALWHRLQPFIGDERRGQKVFRHALVRDAAYEGLSYRRRRALHQRAAESIEKRAPGTDEHAGLLSLHYMHAERNAETWKYAVIAGDNASELYANAEAATYYRRALAAAKRIKEFAPGAVARVWESLGDADERTGAYNEAAKAYAQARHLSDASTDRSRLLRKSGVVHERTARYRAALSCYTRGRDLVGGSGPHGDDAVERCEHAIAYAGVRYRQGKHRECLRWAEVAVDEASQIAYRPGLAHALYLQDIALSSLGMPSQSIAERSLAIYEELGDLIGQGNALNNMGVEAYFRGRWSESLDLYGRSARAREHAGDVTGAATEQNNIAEILSDQGHHTRARELFATAREVWIAAGYKVGIALATSNLGRLAGRAGDIDYGIRLLTDARARFESIGSLVHQLEADSRLIELLLIDGRIKDAHDEAERLVHAVEARGGADALETTAYRLFGIVLARRGRLADGRALLERSTTRAEQQQEAFELALGLAAHATLLDRGHAATRRGIVERSCRQAMEIFESLGVIDVPVTSRNDRWPARGNEILAGPR